MSACSPKSAVSASTADVVESQETCRVDSLSASARVRTSGGEDFARVLQSEREYWCRLSRQQVGDVERAMQEKLEKLESRAVERVKESFRPSIDEVVSELHGKISRSLHQELEVQRAEREAAALQAQRDCQTQAEAALRAAKEEIEARCSAKLDAMRATIGELRGELQEQRQEIAALSERLERLEQPRPERAQALAPSVAAERARAQPRSASLAPRGELPELATLILHKPPALAAGPPAPPAPRPSGVSASVEMPRLLGRVRSQARYHAASPKSTAGAAAQAGPVGTEAGAMPDALKESLKQVVSAVQRTLDDFEEEDPQQGAPGPAEQAAVTSRGLVAPRAQAAAAPHRAPTQQPWGAQAVLAAPLAPVAVHQARQVLVPVPRAGGSTALRPAAAAQLP